MSSIDLSDFPVADISDVNFSDHPNFFDHPFPADFHAFGWSMLSNSSLPPSETYGLDYESAREATPRWYGVSFGNGNDGVSQSHPSYYVKTNDPFTVARAAVIGQFNSRTGQEWAKENLLVDGEAEYTVTAEILDPPEDKTDREETWNCECGEENEIDADECSACGAARPDDDCGSWSDANGAWMLCEVFPVEDYDVPDQKQPWPDRPAYETLAECFDEDVLALVG